MRRFEIGSSTSDEVLLNVHVGPSLLALPIREVKDRKSEETNKGGIIM